MENPTFWSKNQTQLDQACTKTRFERKVAVVVGGASGIGFATVERFLNDGAFVAIVDVDRTGGRKAEEFVKGEGFEKVRYFYADATKRETCDEAAKAIAEANNGVIDFVVNSAVNFSSKGLKSEPSDWDRSLNVNIYGSVTMIQSCYEFMLKASNPAIVNLSSAAANRAQPQRWNYAACKGAIKSMTQNMALDLGKKNIRVNSVAPGYIWSPVMTSVSPDGSLNAISSQMKSVSMLQRAGNTSEVASLVTFLCSRDASYVTGNCIEVDGGYSAMGVDASIAGEMIADIVED